MELGLEAWVRVQKGRGLLRVRSELALERLLDPESRQSSDTGSLCSEEAGRPQPAARRAASGGPLGPRFSQLLPAGPAPAPAPAQPPFWAPRGSFRPAHDLPEARGSRGASLAAGWGRAGRFPCGVWVSANTHFVRADITRSGRRLIVRGDGCGWPPASEALLRSLPDRTEPPAASSRVAVPSPPKAAPLRYGSSGCDDPAITLLSLLFTG